MIWGASLGTRAAAGALAAEARGLCCLGFSHSVRHTEAAANAAASSRIRDARFEIRQNKQHVISTRFIMICAVLAWEAHDLLILEGVLASCI